MRIASLFEACDVRLEDCPHASALAFNSLHAPQSQETTHKRTNSGHHVEDESASDVPHPLTDA